jgi:hypothetical protein
MGTPVPPRTRGWLTFPPTSSRLPDFAPTKKDAPMKLASGRPRLREADVTHEPGAPRRDGGAPRNLRRHDRDPTPAATRIRPASAARRRDPRRAGVDPAWPAWCLVVGLFCLIAGGLST